MCETYNISSDELCFKNLFEVVYIHFIHKLIFIPILCLAFLNCPSLMKNSHAEFVHVYPFACVNKACWMMA